MKMSVSHPTDRGSKLSYFLFNQIRRDCRLSTQIRLYLRLRIPQVRPPRRRRRSRLQTPVPSKIVFVMLFVNNFVF